MDTFYDRKADRLFVTEPAHPVIASAILAFAVVWAVLCGALPSMETERVWLLLFEAVCVAMTVFLLWAALKTFTEVVVTFDGPGRTLSIVRTRPWRRTEENFGFADIVAVDTRRRLVPDAIGNFIWFAVKYSLEITLAGDRRISLSANGETESDDTVRQAGQLIGAARRRG
jgi:hypothetical protein